MIEKIRLQFLLYLQVFQACSNTWVIPNLMCKPTENDSTGEACSDCVNALTCVHPPTEVVEHAIPLEKFSNLKRAVRVTELVLRFVNKMKLKLHEKGKPVVKRNDDELYRDACNFLIKTEQRIKFPEVFEYFSNPLTGKIPPIIAQQSCK